MGLGWPLSKIGRDDLDVIDVDSDRFVGSFAAGHAFQMEEFVTPRKGRLELSKRIALDLTQGNIEVDVLRGLSRCGDGDVMVADDFGKIRVVAGVGTED